jgi:putative flippase GtrA
MRLRTGAARPINFLVVGAWNTLFGYLCFTLLYAATRRWNLHYDLVLVPATILAILQSFTCYKLWVFRTRGNILVELPRFFMVYSGGFVFNLAALPLLVGSLGFHPVYAQAILVVLGAVLSFAGHSVFSFRTKTPGEP